MGQFEGTMALSNLLRKPGSRARGRRERPVIDSEPPIFVSWQKHTVNRHDLVSSGLSVAGTLPVPGEVPAWIKDHQRRCKDVAGALAAPDALTVF